MKHSVAMRRELGGLFEVDDATIIFGEEERLESLRVIKRRVEHTIAVENKVKKKPSTRRIEIFSRSARGRGGARGSITRFGTKNTASQRVRKERPGLKRTLLLRSTNFDWPTVRREVMSTSRNNMAANGGGNTIFCVLSR